MLGEGIHVTCDSAFSSLTVPYLNQEFVTRLLGQNSQ